MAVLPFLSTRYAVRAAELVTGTPADHTSAYDRDLRAILTALTAGFRDDAVNLVMAHLTVLGGTWGGGERAAQSIFEYAVPSAIFPVDAHYVALGHLHRRQTHGGALPGALQRVAARRRLRRAGEHPGRLPGRGHPRPRRRVVTDIPIQAGRRLRTLRGSVAELSRDG